MPSFSAAQSNGASPHLSTNPVLERMQTQWLFSSTELLRTPSILEGMPIVQELANRQKGVNFITQVGIMLKLPQITLATASVYLHRFFMRHAMALPNKSGVHHYSVAATALFLATKVEENCRKMRELVVACCRAAQKQPNLVVDEQSKEYWKWRDTILHNEDLLLEALCFDLQIEKPHRILFDFLCYYGVQDNKTLRNTSWAFLNDSHVTTMCLLHSPRTIAGSALYAGTRLAGISLPDDELGRSWWEHLALDVYDIQKACNLMAEVYENPALPRQGQKDAYTKEDDLAMFDRTRHMFTPGTGQSPIGSARSGSQGIKRDREDIDGEYSEHWGADATSPDRIHSANTPSPKRQRRDSIENEPQTRQSQNADKTRDLPTADLTRNDKVVDDVQQKIDAIINASNGSQVINASQTQPRKPAIRHEEPRPQKSPLANQHTRPPVSSGIDPTGYHDRNDNSDSGFYGGDKYYSGQRHHDARYASSHTPSDEKTRSVVDQQARQQTSRYNGINDIDDAEKVDYGSEEGEL